MKNWQSGWANSKEAYVPDWCRKYDAGQETVLVFQGLGRRRTGSGNSFETRVSPGCHVSRRVCYAGPRATRRGATIRADIIGNQAALAQTRCRHRLACPPGETAPCRRRQYTKSRNISARAFHSGVVVVVLAFVAAVALDVDLTAAAVGAEEIAGAHERAWLFGDDPEPQVDQLW